MVNSTTPQARATARFVRGSASKVRRVLTQIRGRSYRDALIMLEFMPYRATEMVTQVLRSAVANAEHNLSLDPSTLMITQATADMGPSMRRYRPRAQGRAIRSKNKLATSALLWLHKTLDCHQSHGQQNSPNWSAAGSDPTSPLQLVCRQEDLSSPPPGGRHDSSSHH